MAIIGGLLCFGVMFGVMFGNKGDAVPYLILGVVGLALLAGAGIDAAIR